MNLGHFNWTPPPHADPSLLSAAYFQIQRGWKSRKLENHCWVVDASLEDFGMVRVGSPRAPWLRRKAGVVHLYRPGTPYWEDSTGMTAPSTACYVTFLGGQTAGLNEWTTNKYNYARLLDPEGRIPACIRNMALAGQRHGEQGYWLAQAALCELFQIIRQAAPVKDQTYRIEADAQPSSSSMVAQTREYFQGHLHKKVTLSDLAKRLHMSPSAFSHRFRAETGQSPMAMLTEYRIRAAKSLLLRGRTLAEAASRTGFHDAYHLSKTFKKLTGSSPREALRSLRSLP